MYTFVKAFRFVQLKHNICNTSNLDGKREDSTEINHCFNETIKIDHKCPFFQKNSAKEYFRKDLFRILGWPIHITYLCHISINLLQCFICSWRLKFSSN